MSLVAMKTPYLLKISLDEDAPNPREDYDHLGNMVCWHRHYRLGDEHHYEDPGDFLQELVKKNMSEEEIIKQAKAGQIPGVKVGYVRAERLWAVESYDGETHKWNRWYGFEEPFVRCKSELADAVLSEMGNHALLKLAEASCCILPVYLFDHSVVRQIKRGCFRQIKTVRQEASGKHHVTLLSVYSAHWKKQQTTHAD